MGEAVASAHKEGRRLLAQRAVHYRDDAVGNARRTAKPNELRATY